MEVTKQQMTEMQDLIRVGTQNIGCKEVDSVNSRAIYEYLNVQTKYADWIKRAIDKYGFVEWVDFQLLKNENSNSNNPMLDYIVTLDMAKELCMVSNTPNGRVVRQYFIRIERSKPELSYDQIMNQALLMSKERMEAAERKNLALLGANNLLIGKNQVLYEEVADAKEEIIERDKAVEFLSDRSEAVGIATWAGLMFNIQGIDIGERRLFVVLRALGYLTMSTNQPKQIYKEQKLFVTKQSTYINSRGQEVLAQPTPMVTQKGIDKLTPIIRDYVLING